MELINCLKINFVILVIWNLYTCSCLKAENLKIEEYCDWESFNVTCKENEIIIIKTAFYGRMNLGRCVGKDFGNIGCETDVTSDLDRKCSGRRHCLFPVISLHGKSICSSDLKSYMEVSYECLKAGSDNVTTCPTEGFITMNSTTGQIASSLVHETGIGGPKCPVRIIVEPYQSLNVTMIDFSVPLPSDIWYPMGHYEPFRSSCDHSSGFITERQLGSNTAKNTRNVSVCAGASSGSRLRHRKSTIYMSKGNVVDVVINSETHNTFILVYYAIGCAPIEPPPHANVKRGDGVAVVECNDTHEAWYLTCVGTQWVGTIGNCTKHNSVVYSGGAKKPDSWDFNGFISNMTTYPYGILMVVALGIAIGVAIGVFLLAVVLACFRQRRLQKIRSRSSHYILKASESEYEDGIRNNIKCTSLTDSSSLLTKREDPYTCPSMHHQENYPIMDPKTLQVRHISPTREDQVIMTSLPDPPSLSPPPVPLIENSGPSRSNSSKKKKKDKTMDYNWDSLSINENEINELATLRDNRNRIPHHQRNAFSISYNDQGKPVRPRRAMDEPYYFKFDGVVGYKIHKDIPRPDIVPAACSACNYNTDDHTH